MGLCRDIVYDVVMLPTVTAADLASFRPLAATVSGEPAGLGIAGLPINLVASASVHTLSGPLLGYDVTVRFTPVAYRFAHGDGTARTSETGGASWARLGLPDFSPTATSHVFTAPGSYRVEAFAVYDAAVDFGTGVWRPVVGRVTAAASPYEVRILEARTALVARTCLEQPAGPGC